MLSFARWRICDAYSRKISRVLKPVARPLVRVMLGCGRRLVRFGRWSLNKLRRLPTLVHASSQNEKQGGGIDADDFAARAQALIDEFRRRFPDRADALSRPDLVFPYEHFYHSLKRLLQEYDIIQGYSTDPFWPLLCDKRPYIGYEHGTLRDIPYAATRQGRVTTLGYALADGVFITNGDCRPAITRLGLSNAVPMIHPIDERVYTDCAQASGGA